MQVRVKQGPGVSYLDAWNVYIGVDGHVNVFLRNTPRDYVESLELEPGDYDYVSVWGD